MINFQITTPEKVVYKDKIDKVSVPTQMGQITILPGHIALISNLAPGELLIYHGESVYPYAVSGGFIEVRPGNNVIILADSAEHAEEIDVKRAEEAAERARSLMAGASRDDVKFAEATALLERSMNRLRIARKRRHRQVSNMEP